MWSKFYHDVNNIILLRFCFVNLFFLLNYYCFFFSKWQNHASIFQPCMYTWLKSCWEIGFIRERATTLLKKNIRLERHVVPRVTQNESSLSVKPQRIRLVIVYWVACVTQACNALRVSVRIQYGRLNCVLFPESIIHLHQGLVWCSDITIGDDMHSHGTKKTSKCLKALPYLHSDC